MRPYIKNLDFKLISNIVKSKEFINQLSILTSRKITAINSNYHEDVGLCWYKSSLIECFLQKERLDKKVILLQTNPTLSTVNSHVLLTLRTSLTFNL